MSKTLKKAIWEFKTALLHSFGRITVHNRMNPSFLIIGTQKGGTSSLFYYLKFHPQIKRPIKKELQYFNINYNKGLNWYLSHYPSRSNNFITGEASPDYLFHPDSPKRVHDLYPNIKLIALLRNPIERAYSAYQMNKRLGIDPRGTFQEAINYELNKLAIDNESYSNDRHNYYYLERGKYAKQLSVWLDFFSKNQIIVLKSEDLFNKTSSELLKVYNFLKIDQILPSSFTPMNVGRYSPISENLSIDLFEYYKDDLNKLKENWNIEFTF